MDYFNPFWEAFDSFAGKIPFCIWGAGYCDLKNENSLPDNRLIEKIVGKTTLCIVRDRLSWNHLKNVHLPSPVPCPSINTIELVLEKYEDLLHVDNYTTAGAETYEKMCRAAENFAQEKQVKSRQTNNRINANNENQMRDILEIYKHSGYVLSSALHGCIIGVSMGKKVLAISGDWKIEGFMAEVGLSDWVLDTSEIDRVPMRLRELDSQAPDPKILEIIKSKNREVSNHIKQLIQDNR